MTAPLPSSAPCQPLASFIHGRFEVTENVRLARDTFRIRIASPGLAVAIRPGQFLMIRLPGTSDPLLGRPFALYDTVLDSSGQPTGVDVVYLVVGKMTRALTELRAGDVVEIWGPLGNGFPSPTCLEHIGLVAGGIGQTPFLAYVRELLGERGYGGKPPKRGARKVSLYYGVRTADLAAGIDDFRSAGAEVHLASDDGTLGFHGFVTQLLEQHHSGVRSQESGVSSQQSGVRSQQSADSSQYPPLTHIIGCGPGPMMKALAELAKRWGVPCHLSLETPMACGVGICFSCVTPVRTEGGWDYRRVCVEGPVFDAESLADMPSH